MDFQRLLKISRPRFWLYLLGSYMVGFVAGSSSLSTQLSTVFLTHLFLFSLPANLFLYAVNDIYDAQTDKHNPKKNIKEVRLSPSDRSYLFTLLPGLFGLLIVTAFSQPNNLSRLLMTLFIFLAFFYSAPPLRFKAVAGLDFASNVLYIIPGLLGFAQLTGSLPTAWVIVGASLFTWGLHLFSAIPDINVDRKAGVITTAVALGYEKSLLLVTLFWGLMAALVISFTSFNSLTLVSLIFPALSLYLFVDPKAKIDPVYWSLPYLNGFLGFVLYWYLVFVGDKWPW